MKKSTYYLLGAVLFLTNAVYAQDCPPPTCTQSFSVTIHDLGSGDCEALVYATDLITPDPALCDPNFDFAIYRTSEVDAVGSGFVPNPADSSLLVTTDDLATSIVSVYVYIFVTPTQYAACTSNILITEGDECEYSPPVVSGYTVTQLDESVANVEVNTEGDFLSSYITLDNGEYYFNHYIGDQFAVRPLKNDNPLNGVTTVDIVNISKHILGLELLETPYDIIAADVNQSGTVSTIDILQIRKLILGIYNEFPSSNSWRFVPADYVFPNPSNPWEEVFPETIYVPEQTYEMIGADFIAIKMGDVNGSAVTN